MTAGSRIATSSSTSSTRRAGAVVVAEASVIGWQSEAMFQARFREEIGLSPKTLARVLQFGRAVTIIMKGGGARLAEIAQDCGYYDQAHFTRDCHAFAGVTPTELVRSRLPDGAGFAVDR